jgi:hypothetical protein
MTCTAKRHDPTPSVYCHFGCRCPATVAAKARYDKQRKAAGNIRRVASTITHRKIQALVAAGWPMRELGLRLGRNEDFARKLLRHRHVFLSTAVAIDRLYTQLNNLPGPSNRARVLAVGWGWAPPIAWDDDTIDDPDAKPAHQAEAEFVDDLDITLVCEWVGKPLDTRKLQVISRLTRAERAAVIDRLHAAGHIDRAIGELLGVTTTAVNNHRIRRCHRTAVAA